MKTFTQLFSLLLMFAGGGSLLLGQQTLTIDFTFSPTQPCAGQPIIFQDASTNMWQNSWFEYSFGDGTFGYASAFNSTSHVYSAPGIYTVSYRSLDTSNTTLPIVTKTIFVQAGPCMGLNFLSGYVYHDANLNNTFDPQEVPISGQVIQIGPYRVQTDTNGYYQIYPGPGIYTVSVADPSPYVVSFPISGRDTFAMSGNNGVYTRDFGMIIPAPFQDLEVQTYNINFLRPGRIVRYPIIVNNRGTVPVSGTVSFTYDDSLVFLPYPIYGGIHDPLTRTISFSFPPLAPSQVERFWVTCQVPQTVPIGTSISVLAKVEPIIGDSTPGNNIDTWTTQVRGSWDPNDKAVSPEGFIAPDQELTYRIRFQNTGNDTAFNVFLIDSLDSNLDFNTFKMLSASHAYDFQMNDQGHIRWQFDNILLPDSSTNLLESQGYVSFTISPIPNLPDSTLIEGFTDIYFDYNQPVRTNTTQSYILDLDSAAFSVTNHAVSGLNNVLDFEAIYPQVSVIAKNVGIKANSQALKYYIQLDSYAPQEIVSTLLQIPPSQHHEALLSNFCIRSYYPGIPLTATFIQAPHSITIYAEEQGKANRVSIATFPVGVSTPLPFSLSFFHAKEQADHIQLTWATSTEGNSSHFEVEKYRENTRGFERIGNVDAADFSSSPLMYSFDDLSPVPGMNRYRLVPIDLAGNQRSSAAYAEIYFQQAAKQLEVNNLFPNPFQKTINWDIQTPVSGKMTLDVFDIFGKRVWTQSQYVSAGSTIIEANLSSLSRGAYFYQLSINEHTRYGKCVKQ